MIGLDTETQDGKMILACDSTGRAYEPNERAIRGGGGFSFFMQWLQSHESYVCWNLRFDAQAIFALLSRLECWELARFGKCCHEGTDIEWIDGKRVIFKQGSVEVSLYDAYQFYHCGLEKASKEYLGESKLDSGLDKENMGYELRMKRKHVIEYCIDDAKKALKLWNIVEDGLKKVGCPTANPISPAFLAAKYFLRKKDRLGEGINAIAENAYFGGRIECYQRGYFEKLYCYDIHSAYPYQFAFLPEMGSLDLVTGRLNPIGAVLGIYLVELSGSDRRWPVWYRGKYMYPLFDRPTKLWVDLKNFPWVEYNAGEAEVLDSYQWFPGRREMKLPFCKAVHDLYKLRKSSPSLNLACKLLLNGVYGKLASFHDGYEEVFDVLQADLIENGRFLKKFSERAYHQNMVYAAHITGGCRAMIGEALDLADPDSVVLISTDGIYTTKPIPELQEGSQLGQWGYEVKENVIVVGCGVYEHLTPEYLAGEKDARPKTTFRGFRTNESIWESCHRETRKEPSVIPISCSVPGTMLYALKTGGDINYIGKWERELNLNFDSKRKWPHPLTKQFICEKKHQKSSPYKISELEA